MREIYLDNSATTVVCREAAEKAMSMMCEVYGNPSSLHSKGYDAHRELEEARKITAKLISADPEEIFFTSGGTESNNTAIHGAAKALKRRGNKIVTTSVEHSSVLEAVRELEKEGFEAVYLPVDKYGRVSAEDIEKAIDKNTILVSIMSVNNETGAIQPTDCVRRIIDRNGSPALFHTDAVQAFGKLPIKVKKTGADLVSASSHKIHGPKGAGVLYVRRGARILPLHHGGEQEKRMRPGTECVPAVCAMGQAIKALPEMRSETEHILRLNNRLRERLNDIENVVINSDADCLPYILNFSVCGIRSETMLHFLEERGIFVSSGSACAKGMKSHVIKAMGLDSVRADSAIRVSFSRYNSEKDVDDLADSVILANNILARTR